MISYNINFPINDDLATNDFLKMTKVTKDAFSSDLLLLLLTQVGERYYEPNYGTNLIKYIFEPNDNTTTKEIEREIKETVQKYIPELGIDSVVFFDSATDDTLGENEILMNIKFTYSEGVFSETGELELKF